MNNGGPALRRAAYTAYASLTARRTRAVKSDTRLVGKVRRRKRPIAPPSGLGELVRASAGCKAVRDRERPPCRSPVPVASGEALEEAWAFASVPLVGVVVRGRARLSPSGVRLPVGAGRLFSNTTYPPAGASSSESDGSRSSIEGLEPSAWAGGFKCAGRSRRLDLGGRSGGISGEPVAEGTAEAVTDATPAAAAAAGGLGEVPRDSIMT